MTDSHSPGATVEETDRQRPRRAVWLLAGLVGLEGLCLVAAGLFQTVGAIVETHSMPFGAILIMSLLYIGYGAWLAGAARAVLRGSLWPRALILLTQVFLVVIALQMVSAWGWLLVMLPVLYGVVVALLLFSGPVQSHLLRANGLDGT